MHQKKPHFELELKNIGIKYLPLSLFRGEKLLEINLFARTAIVRNVTVQTKSRAKDLFNIKVIDGNNLT